MNELCILLKFIDERLERPRDNYNDLTHEYDSGYRKALENIKERIEVLILNTN